MVPPQNEETPRQAHEGRAAEASLPHGRGPVGGSNLVIRLAGSTDIKGMIRSENQWRSAPAQFEEHGNAALRPGSRKTTCCICGAEYHVYLFLGFADASASVQMIRSTKSSDTILLRRRGEGPSPWNAFFGG